ncbi:MAG: hypothetical protein QGG42_07225 [Phycisphaerae bacterium]|jgi:hypothetical protein|nr:hypothetical protein [Phycisphaerae bacterium]
MVDAKRRIAVLVLLAMMTGCGGGAEEEKDHVRACSANLHNIASACTTYSSMNRKYPESLQSMLKEGKEMFPSDLLKCPGDNSQRACGYFYVAPEQEADNMTLMLCDLPGNHKQVRCVAFKCRVIKQLTKDEFQAALKLPHNAAFAAALEKAGG